MSVSKNGTGGVWAFIQIFWDRIVFIVGVVSSLLGFIPELRKIRFRTRVRLLARLGLLLIPSLPRFSM